MVSAHILIESQGVGQLSDVRAAHDALHQIQGVKTVHFVMGPIDAIVYVEAADLQALVEVIGKVHAVKGVGKTDTCIVMPM